MNEKDLEAITEAVAKGIRRAHEQPEWRVKLGIASRIGALIVCVGFVIAAWVEAASSDYFTGSTTDWNVVTCSLLVAIPLFWFTFRK